MYYLHNNGLTKSKSLRAIIPVKYKKQFVQSIFTTYDGIATYTKMLLRQDHLKWNINDVSHNNIANFCPIRSTSLVVLFDIEHTSDTTSDYDNTIFSNSPSDLSLVSTLSSTTISVTSRTPTHSTDWLLAQ